MQYKLIFVLLLIISAMGVGSYKYYNSVQAAKQVQLETIAKLEVAVKEQKAALELLDRKYKQQITAVITLSESNATLYSEKLALSDKLLKHDLEFLSRKKPNLIETRINNGTKELFDSFTDITTK